MSNVSKGAGRSAKSRGRRATLLAGPMVTVMCVPALGGPEGERVEAGSAEFSRRGSHTTIRAADDTIINYSGFDIGAEESVRFVQPGSDARVLNRVNSPEPTQVNGTLTANGRVFLVNPAGVRFGAGSVVDVGRLYAAAGSISNEDFLAGRNRFDLSGEVVNEGHIRGSGVALMGRHVANFGRIVAPEGAVTMAAGDHVLIGERGGHVFAKVSADRARGESGGIELASLENGGEVTAADGQVQLAAGDVYALAVHETSEIRARQVAIHGGDESAVSVSGAIDVSDGGAEGTGGRVTVTGGEVGLYGADIDATGALGGGEVLIGGDVQGGGDLDTAAYSLIDGATTIAADARERGDGGKVVQWADQGALFGGTITARGAEGGIGGFVETSGKQTLRLAGGSVDAPGGTWLLDPTDVMIRDGTGDPAGDGNDTFEGDPSGSIGQVLGGDTGPTEIFESELEGLAAGVDIVIEATNDITLEDLSDDTLSLATGGGNSVTLTANSDGTGGGAFVANDPGDTIVTQGGSITINGQLLTLPELATNGGNVTINGANTSAGNVTTSGGDIEFMLTGGLSMNASDTLSAGAGEVTIDGTMATGTPSYAIGDVATSGAYTVDAGGLDIQQIGDVNAGSASFTGGTINIFQVLTASSGDVTLSNSGTLTLQDDFALTANSGAINQDGSGSVQFFRDDMSANSVSFSGTLELFDSPTITASDSAEFAGIAAGGGTRTLTVNADGATTFGGPINSADLSITTDDDAASGATTISGAIQDAATLTFNDEVNVNADVTATSITFDGPSTTIGGGGPRAITTRQTMEFNSGLDAQSLGLTLEARELNLLGGADSVTGSGDLTIQPFASGQAMQLGGTNAGGELTLTSTDLAALDTTFNLVTLGRDDQSNDLLVSDTVTFETDTTLLSDASTIDVNNPVMAPGQTLTFGSATNLNADVSGGAVLFESDVTTPGGTPVIVDADGAISFGNDDQDTLTLNNNLVANADMSGGGASLDFYNIVGNGNLLDARNAAGETTFNDVSGGSDTLDNVAIVTDTIGGSSPGATTINQAITNGQSLTFNDDVNLNADVSGTSVAFNANVTTTGTRVVTSNTGLAFGDADDDLLTMGGGLTANADQGGGGNALDFYNVSGGGNTLTANNAAGDTTFNDVSGGSDTLDNLGITTDAGAGTTSIDQAITSGQALTFGDNVNLNADATASGAAMFDGQLTVEGDDRVLSAGSAAFAGGIVADGSTRLLTVNSGGTTAIDAAVNGPMLSLTTDAAGTSVISAPIQNAAAVTFNDPATLGADVSANSVEFAGALTVSGGDRVVASSTTADFAGIEADGSARLLTVNASGATTLGSAIDDGMLSITTDAAGTSVIDGEIQDAATLTFGDNATVNADVSADSVTFGGTATLGGTGDRAITGESLASFASTVDAQDHNLTIEGDEIELMGGMVTSSNAVDLILRPVSNGTTMELSGTADGSQLDLTSAELGRIDSTFNRVTFGRDDQANDLVIAGATTLANDTTLLADASTIDVMGDVNGGVDVIFGASTVLNADVSVGSVTFEELLSVDGGSTRTVATTGTADFAAIDAAGSGTARSLAINADGTATLGGAINDADLSVTTDDDAASGSTVIDAAIQDAAALTFNDNVTLNEDVTANSIAFTEDVTTSGARSVTAQAALAFGDASDDVLTLGDDLVATADQSGGGGNALDFYGVAGGGGILTANNASSATNFNAAGAGVDDVSVITDAGSGGTVIDAPFTDSAMGTPNSVTFNDGVTLNADITGFVDVAFNADVATSGTRTVSAKETLSFGDAAGDTLTLGGMLTATADSDDNAGGSDVLSLNTVAGGSNALVTDSNAGDTTFNADATVGSLDATGREFGLGGDIDTSGSNGNQTYTGMSRVLDPAPDSARRLTAGSGTLTFTDMIDLNGFDLELIAGDVVLPGMSGSVKDTSGGGALVLAPDDPTRAIDVGNVASPQGGAFTVDQSDLDALSGTGIAVTIGRANGQHANFQIDDATFGFDALFRTPSGGLMQVVGPTENTASGSGTTFEAPDIELGAMVTTNAGAATFTGPVTLVSDSTLATSGGDATAESTIDGGFGLTIQTLASGDGDADVQGVIGGTTALGSLDIEGAQVDLSGIGAMGSAGVTGTTSVLALGEVRLSGGLYEAGEQTYAADAVVRLLEDTDFVSSGSNLTFTTAGLGGGPAGQPLQGVLLDSDSSMTARTMGGDMLVTTAIRNQTSGMPEADLDFDAAAGSIGIQGPIGGTGVQIAGTAPTERVDQILMRGSTISTRGARSSRSQTYQAASHNIRDAYETVQGGADADVIFEPATGTSTQVTLTGDATVQTAGQSGDDAVFGDPMAGEPGAIDGGFGLTVDAGDGNASVEGVIGGATALSSLDISAFDVSLNGIGFTSPMEQAGVTGATNVTAGSTLTLRSGQYNANQQTYTSAGQIGIPVDSTFLSNGMPLDFAGGGFVDLMGADLTVGTAGGGATFGVEVTGDTGSESLSVDAGTGTASFDAIGGNEAGGDAGMPTVGDISVVADEVDFTDSVFGQTLSIESSTDGLPMFLGVGSGSGGQLDLTVAELAQLRNGFNSITIGAPMGTNAITIVDATFRDPVTIQAPQGSGSLLVDGTLRGNNDASVTLLGPGSGTTLQGDILTQGNDVLIDDGVEVALDSTIDTDAAGMGSPGDGGVEFTGTLDGPAALDVLALDRDDSARGDVIFGQDIGANMALSMLTVSGDSIELLNIGTGSDEGVTGAASFMAFDDIVFNGASFNAGEQRYEAGDENRLTQDALFQTPGGPIAFEVLADPTGDIDNFQGVLLNDGADLTAMTSGGDISTGDIRRTPMGGGDAQLVLDAGMGAVETGLVGIPGAMPRSPGSLEATGSTIDVAGVTTVNAQTYNGDATIRGDLTSLDSGAIEISGNTTVTSDVRFDTAGAADDDVILMGTLDPESDGGASVTVNAGSEGDLTIDGDAGGGFRLGDFTIEDVAETQIAALSADSVSVMASGPFTASGDITTTEDAGMGFTGTSFDIAGGLDAMGDGGLSVEAESFSVGGATSTGPGGVDVAVDDSATFTGRVSASDDAGVTIASRGMNQLNDVTLGDGVESGSAGIAITGEVFDFDGLFRTTGEGEVELDHLGNLTFGPGTAFDLSGDFTQLTDAPVIFEAPAQDGERIELVSFGNTVSFTGPVTLNADALFRGLDVTFMREVIPGTDGGASLLVRGDGTHTFMEDIGGEGQRLQSLRVRSGSGGVGAAELMGDVYTSGLQRYEVETTLSGGSDEMSRGMLDAGGRIRFDDQFTTSGFTGLVAGADLLFQGNTDLFGADQVLDSQAGTTFESRLRVDGVADVVSQSDIAFRGPVDARPTSQQNVAGQLNVRLDADRTTPDPMQGPVPALEAAADDPQVVIAQSVGGQRSLAGLSINSNAMTSTRQLDGETPDTDVPVAPTIVIGEPLGEDQPVPDLEIAASSVEAGFFEVINANANLVINASGTVALPDTNVLGSLTINAPRLELRARPAAPRVLFSPEGGLQGLTFNSNTGDSGADVVVAGIQRMGGSDVIRSDAVFTLNDPNSVGGEPDVVQVDPPTMVDGEPNFLFSAPEGQGSLGGVAQDALSGFSVLRPFSDQNAVRGNFRVASELEEPMVDEGADLRASGIGENPASTRALAVAASASVGEIQQEANPGTIGEEELRQIGIELRDLTRDALIDSIVGFSLYKDLEETQVLGQSANRSVVTRNRLDFELVERVVRQYDELFFRISRDETGEPAREERVPEIQADLEAALLAYFEQTGTSTINPAEFNSFLRESDSSEARATRQMLSQVRDLLSSVRSLGIGPAEYQIARDRILSTINIEGMPQDTFAAIVEQSGGGDAGQAESGANGDEAANGEDGDSAGSEEGGQ